MMPEVCRCKHPVHHVDRSLLCHCIHTLLMGDSLENTEEKNCIALLSALVEVRPCGHVCACSVVCFCIHSFMVSSILENGEKPYWFTFSSHEVKASSFKSNFDFRLLPDASFDSTCAVC